MSAIIARCRKDATGRVRRMTRFKRPSLGEAPSCEAEAAWHGRRQGRLPREAAVSSQGYHPHACQTGIRQALRQSDARR